MGYFLEIDASQVISLANQLADQIGQERAQRILDRTIWKTAKQMKTPIAKGLRSVYAAPSGWIKAGILAPKMTSGACIIPLSGFKGRIGITFPRRGSKYNIKAEILRGKASKLPARLPNQGGNPPFRSGAVVRTTSASGGHPGVVGLALPQMPMPNSKGYPPTSEVIEEKMLDIFMRATRDILGGWV